MTTTAAKTDEVVEACRAYGHKDIIVLSGVPATGKTHVAKAAATAVAGHPGFVRRTQFHPGYAYDDFIEGLKPLETGGYAPQDGVFLEWNNQAKRDSANTYVLLIEELSRADIPSVLGELMTFIEYRGETFTLPISRAPASVASNLVILATMNPRDRSALEVDEAMIRRLRIIDCLPDMDQLSEVLHASLSVGDQEKQTIIDLLSDVFKSCETEFPDLYQNEMPFGHAVFDGVRNGHDLHALWHQRIKRVLYRPQGLRHPFADAIAAKFPWQFSADATIPNKGNQP